jgi:signal peptidase I
VRFAIVAALVATAAMTWMRRHLVRVVVDGPSMEPAFSSGSRLLIRRVMPGAGPVHMIRAGVVVVLEAPAVGAPAGARVATGRWVVKRVAAVPGDPLPSAVAVAIGAPSGSRVPTGHLAVLGDNPHASVDSRHYGPVPLERVLGVALTRR